ncbi:MAG TPA: type II secretion system protein [Tepidisphaeraceae bacterium]|nr:type II secretion system protein [Tepidisphaeraceae bacterium]
MSSGRQRDRAFSLVELLVVIGIVAILISIFVPYVVNMRETEHRARCAANLRTLMQGLQSYAKLNRPLFPQVVYDAAHNPNGYTAFTGAAAPDPFARDSQVRPNDVTASLWLLVRTGLAQPRLFVCPSTRDLPDPADPAEWKRRSNFSGNQFLSYSYASPFSSAASYKLNEYLPSDFALMADKNPGIVSRTGSNVTKPNYDSPPLELAQANSNNHGRAGQNVLYADGHVAFQITPYCGTGSGGMRDNIYTALQRLPLAKGPNVPAWTNGVVGPDIAPAWTGDSYLVPTEQD